MAPLKRCRVEGVAEGEWGQLREPILVSDAEDGVRS